MQKCIEKIKHTPEKIVDWPVKLKSPQDIKLYEDVLEALSAKDTHH